MKREVAQPHEPGFAAEEQDLEEQVRKLFAETLAKLAEGVVIRGDGLPLAER